MDQIPDFQSFPPQDFIPPVLAPFGIDPIDCRLIKREDNNKVYYEFELRWKSPREKNEKKTKSKGTEKSESTVSSRSSKSTKISAKSSKTSSSAGFRVPQELPSDLTLYPHPSNLRCKFCKKKLQVRDLLAITDGHTLICRLCTKKTKQEDDSKSSSKKKPAKGDKSKKARQDDDSSASSSAKKPVKADKSSKKVIRSSKSKSRSSNFSRSSGMDTSEPTSITSKAPSHYRPDQMSKLLSQCDLVTEGKEHFATASEMISVRVLLLLRNKEKDTIVRRDFCEEFPASSKLREVVDHVIASITNWDNYQQKIRVWLCPPQKGARMQLLRNKRGEDRLHEIGVHAGQLRLILDGGDLIKP